MSPAAADPTRKIKKEVIPFLFLLKLFSPIFICFSCSGIGTLIRGYSAEHQEARLLYYIIVYKTGVIENEILKNKGKRYEIMGDAKRR